jgi:hypothetical protein
LRAVVVRSDRKLCVPFEQFLPAEYGNLPRNFFTGSPDFDRFGADHGSIGYQFSHEFDDRSPAAAGRSGMDSKNSGMLAPESVEDRADRGERGAIRLRSARLDDLLPLQGE